MNNNLNNTDDIGIFHLDNGYRRYHNVIKTNR